MPQPAGLAIFFASFSTHSCKPLLNIHDGAVPSEYHDRGISKSLFSKAEEIARRVGCCKLTLGALLGNLIAQSA
ncbi:GNAT family N-acetyltransferase [Pseudomonas taeanensis]|uniref:GNAT family N-acetyltransferase n=1 Tax=Pseudomonas taeanensis TaxID=574962 RepID=UPI003899E38C